MYKSVCFALLVLTGSVQAQEQPQPPAQEPTQASSSAAVACPKLPDSSGLTWVHKALGPADLCRALRADGSEAFGMHIARETPFKPKRGNREEKATIDGQAIWWHSSELATQPKMKMRETLLELSDGRQAHIWVQAMSDQDLAAALDQANQLHFQPGQLVGSN